MPTSKEDKTTEEIMRRMLQMPHKPHVVKKATKKKSKNVKKLKTNSD
jgi:hypothetical protein